MVTGGLEESGDRLTIFTVLNQLLLQTNGLRYLSTLVSHSHLACCLGNETGEDSWWYKPILSLMVNMGVPLLASSCCLIQLIINIVAGGCAGFNTVLGPIRPFFVAFLLHLTINTARLSSLQWYGKTALRWLIALLPEMVHVWNNAKVRREKPPLQHHQQQPSSYTSEPNAPTMEVKVEIPTMGCVACINKIDAALRQVPYVMEASSSLNPFGAKGGYAVVKIAIPQSQTHDEVLASETETTTATTSLYTVMESLVAAVESAGFSGSQVESMGTDRDMSYSEEL